MQSHSAISAVIQPQNSNQLLTPPAAAQYLGVSKDTLSVWRCTRRYPIPFIKVGRLVKYRVSDLDAFLDTRTHNNRVEG